tara:strand:+ start:137 stop:1096 length:960 start_codon:yes stop_codon:yes gene_type:complete
MATYKEIHGVKVQYRESDATALEGDVWYNYTIGELRMYTYGAGAWASGGDLNSGREYPAGAGTQTAALCCGGNNPGPPLETGLVEQYDGSSWTEIADLNTIRGRERGHAGGSTTAAIVIAGYSGGTTADTEIWNGASWTEVNDLNTNALSRSSGGSSTAAIASGGAPAVVDSEEWNGTSWTEGNNINTGRGRGSHIGTQTAAFHISQETATTLVESYDGSSWTETTEVNTGRQFASGAGTTSAGLFFAGGPPYQALTESWDGSSWTEVGDLPVASSHTAPAAQGSNISTLSTGGYGGAPYRPNTYEWTSDIAAQTVAFD